MSPNTRLRLWKEARALLPIWAATVGLMLLPYFMRATNPFNFTTPAYWFGCIMLGAATFGLEFQHRSMTLLLMQPVSRRRLWWEKMTVLAVALFALLGLYLGLRLCENGIRFEIKQTHWFFTFRRIANWCYAPIIAFATGPALTLVARSHIGGAALTFLCPWALFMLGMLLWWSPMSHYPAPVESVARFTAVTVIGGIYCGGVFLFGCRRFERWADSHGHRQELTLPAPVLVNFDRVSRCLTPGPSSAFGQLVRKELRLHLSAFVLAGAFVVGWLFLLVDRLTPPSSLPKDIVMLPSMLLCHLIPVLVGIISTAEERNLGLHEWHLTLPVSTRKQWLVKLLVALGLNGLLGLLLPGLLAHASSWLANDPRLVAEIPGSKVPHFLIANAVIFCAALFASTASANPMRALIGAIVVFIAGVTVMGSALMTVDAVPDSLYPMPDRHGWWPAPELCQWAFESITPLGWGFLFWFGALGLANFRHSMEAGWLPLRRLVPFVATIWLVLVAIFTGLRMFSHYDWTYYEMSNSLRWDSQKRAKQRAAEREKMEAVPTTPVPLLNANPGKPPG